MHGYAVNLRGTKVKLHHFPVLYVKGLNDTYTCKGTSPQLGLLAKKSLSNVIDHATSDAYKTTMSKLKDEQVR